MTTFAPNSVSPTPVQHITRRQWLVARIAAALRLPAPRVGKRRAGTDEVFLPVGPDEETVGIDRWRVRPTNRFTISKEDR